MGWHSIDAEMASEEVGYEEIESMEIGTQRAALYAVAGLLVESQSHHKQWVLEKVLESLGVNIAELKTIIQEQGYDFDRGIAP